MLKLYSVADYIIEEYEKFNLGKKWRDQVQLTTKRLNRIVYYCYVQFMLENNGEELFETKKEMTRFGIARLKEVATFNSGFEGPGINRLYSDYLALPSCKAKNLEPSMLTDKDKKSIDTVLKLTLSVPIKELNDEAVKAGTPYDKARIRWEEEKKAYYNGDTEFYPSTAPSLEKSDIYEYYKTHDCPYIQK